MLSNPPMIFQLVTNIDDTSLPKFHIEQCHIDGAQDLDRIGLVDLVISRWPCQGLS